MKANTPNDLFENESTVESAPRLRVVVNAFACSPYRGSEPAVGFQTSSRIGRYHDVTVLYAGRDSFGDQEAEIERYIRENGPVPGVTYIPVRQPWRTRLFFRMQLLGVLWFTYYWGYEAWQKEVLKTVKTLERDVPFQIHHQLNMIGFREPGYLWKLPGCFVWGPVGGASNTPASFLKTMSFRGAALARARNLVNNWQKWTGGRAKKAAQCASALWTVDRAGREMFARWGATAELQLEVGCTLKTEGTRIRTRDFSRPLRLCWSGEHIPRKQFPILIGTLALLEPEERPALTVLGQGLETERWKHLAREAGLTNIRWTGKLSHAEALHVMSHSDVFILTSVQEATGLVVLEALSFGMPVLCHDTCGMGVAVTASSGIKVPVVSLERSSQGFAEALRRLNAETHLLEELSRGALERAKDLTWDVMAEKIGARYTRAWRAAENAHHLSSKAEWKAKV